MEKGRFLSSLFETSQPTYMDFSGAALNFGTGSHSSNTEVLWQTLTCLHLKQLTGRMEECDGCRTVLPLFFGF